MYNDADIRDMNIFTGAEGMSNRRGRNIVCKRAISILLLIALVLGDNHTVVHAVLPSEEHVILPGNDDIPVIEDVIEEEEVETEVMLPQEEFADLNGESSSDVVFEEEGLPQEETGGSIIIGGEDQGGLPKEEHVTLTPTPEIGGGIEVEIVEPTPEHVEIPLPQPEEAYANEQIESEVIFDEEDLPKEETFEIVIDLPQEEMPQEEEVVIEFEWEEDAEEEYEGAELGDFQILSPAEGTVVSSETKLRASWSEADDVDFYRYALSNKTDGYVVLETTKTNKTEVKIGKSYLEPEKTYVLYVTAYKENGDCERREVRFHTAAEMGEDHADGGVNLDIPGSFSVQKGDSITLSGKIRSECEIEKIYVMISGCYDSKEKWNVNDKEFDLSNVTIRTSKLNLEAGNYEIKIWGILANSGDSLVIANVPFYVYNPHREEVQDTSLSQIHFAEQSGIAYRDYSPVISWEAEDSLRESKVHYTVVQVFKKVKNGAVEEHEAAFPTVQSSGVLEQLQKTYEGGKYGIQVGYYAYDNTPLAFGSTVFVIPLSVNVSIGNSVEGETNSIRGKISSAAALKTITCVVKNADTGKEELRTGQEFTDTVYSYELKGSYIDNTLLIDTLSPGRKIVTVSVTDAAGYLREASCEFTIEPEKEVVVDMEYDKDVLRPVEYYKGMPEFSYAGTYYYDSISYKCYEYNGYTYFTKEKAGVEQFVTTYSVWKKLFTTKEFYRRVCDNPSVVANFRSGVENARGVYDSFKTIMVADVATTAAGGVTGGLIGKELLGTRAYSATKASLNANLDKYLQVLNPGIALVCEYLIAYEYVDMVEMLDTSENLLDKMIDYPNSYHVSYENVLRIHEAVARYSSLEEISRLTWLDIADYTVEDRGDAFCRAFSNEIKGALALFGVMPIDLKKYDTILNAQCTVFELFAEFSPFFAKDDKTAGDWVTAMTLMFEKGMKIVCGIDGIMDAANADWLYSSLKVCKQVSDSHVASLTAGTIQILGNLYYFTSWFTQVQKFQTSKEPLVYDYGEFDFSALKENTNEAIPRVAQMNSLRAGDTREIKLYGLEDDAEVIFSCDVDGVYVKDFVLYVPSDVSEKSLQLKIVVKQNGRTYESSKNIKIRK